MMHSTPEYGKEAKGLYGALSIRVVRRCSQLCDTSLVVCKQHEDIS